MYAHQVPIYASSTYVFDDAEQGMRRFSGKEEGYIYSRWGNPTMTEAENKIAALETFGLDMEVKGILHASGMAAISTLMLSTLKPGDKIITHYSLYGGTNELVTKILPGLHITAVIADLRNLEHSRRNTEERPGDQNDVPRNTRQSNYPVCGPGCTVPAGQTIQLRYCLRQYFCHPIPATAFSV